MFSKHRVEALSDGVFSIAMTLLILDIKIPLDAAPDALNTALLHLSHEWISFAVTFGITALFWTFQHRIFDLLSEIDNESLSLTFLSLAFVSILPFSTALWGHHPAQPTAFAIYFLNQFLLAAALTLKLERAHAKGQLKPGLQTDLTRLRLAVICALMGISTVAALLVPLRWFWAIAAPLALAARILRHAQRKRLAHHAPLQVGADTQ